MSLTMMETFVMFNTVFQLENEKGRAPGRALCAKWAHFSENKL